MKPETYHLTADKMNRTKRWEMITAKLQRRGDELWLEIPGEFLEPLGFHEGTSVELSVCGDCLIVQSARDPERQKKFEQALDSVVERYGQTLRRLADS